MVAVIILFVQKHETLAAFGAGGAVRAAIAHKSISGSNPVQFLFALALAPA